MRSFKVLVKVSSKLTRTFFVVAENAWQAIDLVYYREGAHQLQSERKFYKAL
jgi:hypothetical protein